MYEAFFGLHERPFELTPNPRYLLLTQRHQEVLANLQHGIAERKGVTLVLGPSGTGKTTLIRAALARSGGPSARLVTINNPAMTRSEFFQTVARGFDLSAPAGLSKALLLEELERRLLQQHAAHVATALIVDEAQALPDELLEEVRLLVNFETDTEKLLPVVLVGQPELGARLNAPAFAALKQRVTLRCELAALSVADTAMYITTRVRVAGGVPGDLFTREAVQLVHERSGGIPRVISIICDNALLSGLALSRRPVDRRIVLEVCDDFDLGEVRASDSGTASLPAYGSALPSRLDTMAARAIAEEATAPPPGGTEVPLFRMFDRASTPWSLRRG